MEIAQQTNRELVVTAKDAYLLHVLVCADAACRTGSILIYDEIQEKTKRKWEEDVVKKYCGKYLNHQTIHNNQVNYMLAFSFFDIKHLLDIKPDGGSYIYSSCEAFNEEMEIDFRRLLEWLKYFNQDPYGFSLGMNENKEIKPQFEHRYHASGHACMNDIWWIIDQLDPDIVIPVHTDAREWFANNFEDVKLVEEGKPYII